MSKNSIWQTVKSVAAAVFGVQSEQNYQRDFKQNSFVPFLLVGIVFVAIFVLTLVTIVNFVLPN